MSKEPLSPPWLPRFVDIEAADAIIYEIPLSPLKGETEPNWLRAPLNQIIAIRELIVALGERGPMLALHTALLGVTIRIQKPSNEESLIEFALIQQSIDAIKKLRADLPEQISYDLLSRGLWTRPEAAIMATAMLGREIKTDAWRKRVNAWALHHGKSKIDLPTGRRKKPEKI